jgi:ferrous iron transport protein A
MGNALKQVSKHVVQDAGSAGETLDHASIGDVLTVQYVDAPHAAPEWARWLEEIGFIVGERVMLMARGLPGGDPLVVRIGQSTFALRRAEAACVRVASAETKNAIRLEGSVA